MEQNVNELIQSIGKKAKSFHERMTSALQENEVLKGEINQLKSQLETEKVKSVSFESQIEELKSKLSSINTKAVVSSSSDGPTKEEMDELIKEIDFCIKQIKQ